ncbi:MAG: trypsin-like peptidase domain-containing protein [Burkholderiales bacterium]|nr:trypsin-like peptidase domain-containing protein [Burkholderiales bacterium]
MRAVRSPDGLDRWVSRQAAALIVGCLTAWGGPAGAQSLPDFASRVASEQAVVVSITTVSYRTPFALDPDDAQLGTAGPYRGRAVPTSAATGRVRRSLASGFIVSPEGHIVTSAHAVGPKEEMTVRLADGREFVGKLLGADETSDVALLKVDAAGLPSAEIGGNAALAVGDWVAAVGAPFGLERSLTAGIVSAKRVLPESGNFLFIQTDVAINPGSSGSPLFNLGGQVVGMNSMVYTTSGGYMGVSFALPIDMVMEIANQLRAQGQVVRGQLGLSVQELTVGLAHAFALPGGGARGALVARVRQGSMAERAGVRLGDIILGFEARSDMSYDEIQRGIGAKRAGDIAALNVWRAGGVKRIEVQVTARTMPPALTAPAVARAPRGDRLGLVFSSRASGPRNPADEEAGVEVIDTHGPALRAGIGAGDRVVALNDLAIRRIEDYDKAIARLPRGAVVAVLIVRDGRRRYFALATNEER